MNLYPESIERRERRALYELYKDPFKSKNALQIASNCDYRLLKSAFKQLVDAESKTINRLQLFYMLGFINPQPVKLNDPICHKVLQLLADNPTFTSVDIAEKLNTRPTSIVDDYIADVYSRLGFTPQPHHTAIIARLGFYKHIGWFDADRLKREAILTYAPPPPYRQLFGFGLNQRHVDALLWFYNNPTLSTNDFDVVGSSRRSFQRARDHLFTVHNHPLPAGNSTHDVLQIIGYVNVPSYLKHAREYNRIFSHLHKTPFEINRVIGDALFYSPDTVAYQIYKLMSEVQFTPPQSIPPIKRRLSFYAYMGWFDHEALKLHAEILTQSPATVQ